MWVVLRLQEFAVEVKGPLRFPFPIEMDFKPMIGYLPVYATREAALAEFPGGPLSEVRAVGKGSGKANRN